MTPETDSAIVSIVTVTRNIVTAGRSEMLKQCIESVRQQRGAAIEHIVVDGASDDGTVDLLEKYRQQGVITYISETDSGIYNAMNKGISRAKGKYIAFLNSDDYLHDRDGIGTAVRMLEGTGADFSYGATRLVKEDNEPAYLAFPAIGSFVCGNPFCHQSMIARTDAVRKHGGFNEQYCMLADYDLICRLILSGAKGVYVPRVYCSFRISGYSNDAAVRHLIDEERTICHRSYYGHMLSEQDIERLKLGMVPVDMLEMLSAYVHSSLYPALMKSYKPHALGYFTLWKRVEKYPIPQGVPADVYQVSEWRKLSAEKRIRRQYRKYAFLAHMAWGKKKRHYISRRDDAQLLVSEIERLRTILL